MNSPPGLSEGSFAAFRHLKERRDVNTVILRCQRPTGVLVPEVEGNLTHDELLAALPADEPRLVAHELCFATQEGTRRNQQLLIFWDPVGTERQEQAYVAGYSALRPLVERPPLHFRARQADELEYRKLVALANTVAARRPGGR
ncbi:hypothetical protein ACFV7Q_20440 [Streptomyces sp. NPDC059851]|uniref:hypothetical protein n=1 Tax=Streptomyces sp. NPDC059851 TaxID=3346971 RepID=UPI00364E74D3